MYTRFLVALLSLALVSVSPLCVADEISDAIEAAEAAFDSALKSAKDSLLLAYTREITKQTEAGNPDNVTRLITGSKLFESGGLLMEPELEKDYLIFGKAMKTAKDSLLKSYLAATVALSKAGRLADAQEIQQQIRDRELVSKLVSIQMTSRTTLFVMHANYKGLVQELERDNRLNATFEMVVGLSTDGIVRESSTKSGIQGQPGEIVSFRSVSVPKFFLAHGNNELLLQELHDDLAFRQNASFKIHKGLWRSSGVSLEAVNFPDHFLVMKSNGTVRLEKRKATEDFSRYATFGITKPKFPLW